MSKKFLLKLFCVTCLFISLVSCSDDGYHESDKLTANYSNKLADGTAANLSLSYSGTELIGKSIYFKTSDTKTADITLLDILPGERETPIVNVTLTPAESGYIFSGKATGISGINFSYNGKIEDGKLTVNVSDVQLPAHAITTQKKWYTVPYTLNDTQGTDPETGITYNNVMYGVHFHSDSKAASSLASLAEAVGGNILGSVLRNVYFHPDGNITARYAPMPQVDGFLGYIMPLPIRPESDYSLSPLNLVTYYVKDNFLYVVPNIDMIIRLVQSNRNAETRATSTPDYMKIYRLLNRWATTGIRFHIVDEIKPEELYEDYYIKHAGDMILYLDKDEISPLFQLLPMLKDIVPDGPLKTILIPMLESMIPELTDAEVFELGLILQKEYSAEIPEDSEIPAESRFFNNELYKRNVEQLNKILKK
ncbi:DUF4925 domain-containing protein [Bacteroides sp.]